MVVSPQLTSTAHGLSLVPGSVKEPRVKDLFSPSFELWLAAAVTVGGVGVRVGRDRPRAAQLEGVGIAVAPADIDRPAVQALGARIGEGAEAEAVVLALVRALVGSRGDARRDVRDRDGEGLRVRAA